MKDLKLFFLLPQITEEQAAFIIGKSTSDHIFLVDKRRKFNLKTYLCFVDYAKAFDSVQWAKFGKC